MTVSRTRRARDVSDCTAPATPTLHVGTKYPGLLPLKTVDLAIASNICLTGTVLCNSARHLQCVHRRRHQRAREERHLPEPDGSDGRQRRSIFAVSSAPTTDWTHGIERAIARSSNRDWPRSRVQATAPCRLLRQRVSPERRWLAAWCRCNGPRARGIARIVPDQAVHVCAIMHIPFDCKGAQPSR
jgi:hypothetical protein